MITTEMAQRTVPTIRFFLIEPWCKFLSCGLLAVADTSFAAPNWKGRGDWKERDQWQSSSGTLCNNTPKTAFPVYLRFLLTRASENFMITVRFALKWVE